jgi:hypothetical protein
MTWVEGQNGIIFALVNILRYIMYYSFIEIEYVAASFSPARTDLALKLLTAEILLNLIYQTCFTPEHPASA